MKKVKGLKETIRKQIKKKFFIEKEEKFSTACEKLKGMFQGEDFEQMEEYVCNYNLTTRWQTV